MLKNFDKLKGVIVDDDKKSSELIYNIITSHFSEIELKTAHNVASGIKLINTFNPDIAFLDIDMPDGTGFDILKNIFNINFKIIFITGHEEHAVKAIKYSALDYILKPVIANELVKSVKNAVTQINKTNEQIKIETLLQNITQKKNKKIILNTSDNIYILDTDDIIYCKSDNNYTIFHTTDNKRITTSKTLKEYENILPEEFFVRVHRSFIVNSKQISKISKKNSGTIIMKDNSEIPYSVKKKDQLLSVLKNLS